ncbi:hypothetical protein K435DRAFT_104223 [Dendrothele bispora CBS 962.96]|uniref:DUF6741 domain-containing protein n=1 Tax=Dendrothele bispora (strain CBS 962.96) TaxID=1314807 RepID=A0A4V4HI62_DENBC|nr:hypothetical protein K435DRAFT_104223 [Dendrothele bispora CBS 962.96]
MALVFPAYDAYDGYSRVPGSISRRQSVAYGTPYNYYDQGAYRDPAYGEYSSMYDRPMYPSTTAVVPQTHRIVTPPYSDIAVRDSYFPDVPPRPLSAMSMGRQRRHSTVSFMQVPRPPPMDVYRRASSIQIKFKRRGSLLAGISLLEAQSHARLSNNDAFTIHDLHADRKCAILLKIRWAGYNSLTYEIPLDVYDSHISLSTLARRVSRACCHYLQTNHIPVPCDRVELHHLEEISYGVWQPMLSTR